LRCPATSTTTRPAPGLGRFLQADASGYGDGMNFYAYAGNDP
jgi:RHS repeat-associated protein